MPAKTVRANIAPLTFATMTLCSIFLASSIGYAQAPAGRNHPAGVPDSDVITPFGYFDPSCVVHLAKGDTLIAHGRVVQHADGSLNDIPACHYPHYTARGEAIAPDAKTPPPEIGHSWIVSAGITTNTSYGEISSGWVVPPSPISNDGQTLYFFPGMEDANNVVSILQPVLGWNADYAQAWGIASWNCCISGTADESSPVPVNAGDSILGTVTSTCSAGTLSCPYWTVTTTDQSSNQSTTLNNTPSDGQTFNWAFGGVLEVYNVASCNDYPANWSQSLTFYTALYDNNFQLVSNPAWSIANWASGLSPQCNYGGQVVPPGDVTLDYGNPAWTFSTGIPYGNPCNGPGTWSFSLTEQGPNSLVWQSVISTNATQTLSLNWYLYDSQGVFNSGSGYDNSSTQWTASRAPVGTPTLSFNASVLQNYTGCDAQFGGELTGSPAQ